MKEPLMSEARAVTVQPSFLATGRGKLTLTLLCLVAFLDFIDASIVNIALPSIRHDLHFSVQGLQWVLSGYLLTYGGFMLLGGRAGDLLGRRRVLVAGTVLFGVSSLAGGFAGSAGVLVGARLAQGVGAAMMMPAALSIVTTMFKEGSDRAKALGIWGGVAGLASAAGVFLGGVLTQGAGWRWVLFVNPPICLIVLAATYWLISGGRRRRHLLQAHRPDRTPAPDHRRRAGRRWGPVLPGTRPRPRLLPHRPVPRPDSGIGGSRRRVRRRHNGRERRRARRPGRPRRRAAQRLTAGRRRARARGLLRDRGRPHQPPAGRRHPPARSAYLRLPPGAGGRQHRRGRRGHDRAAHQQHPRRSAAARPGAGARAGARAGPAMTANSGQHALTLRRQP